MFCCLSVYFLVVFKTVLRGLWMFGFVGLKIDFWVLFVELGGLLTFFSFQAFFSHVSPRGDPSRFCLVSPYTSHVLKSFQSYCLPLPSASKYTAVLRITQNCLIILILLKKWHCPFVSEDDLNFFIPFSAIFINCI